MGHGVYGIAKLTFLIPFRILSFLQIKFWVCFYVPLGGCRGSGDLVLDVFYFGIHLCDFIINN